MSRVLPEVVAVTLAPFAVTFHKGGLVVLPDAISVPEGMGKVHSFLNSVPANRAVKALADAWEGLLQQGDQVVGGSGFLLCSQMELTVQGFQDITKPVHRRVISQLGLVVQGIPGDFHRVGPVRFDMTQ